MVTQNLRLAKTFKLSRFARPKSKALKANFGLLVEYVYLELCLSSQFTVFALFSAPFLLTAPFRKYEKQKLTSEGCLTHQRGFLR